MNDFLLSYDTVTLCPKHSSLLSRSAADPSISFCGYKFNLPVVPANMEDIISVNNARWMSKHGYFYIYHRFGRENELHPALTTLSFVRLANIENWPVVSISVGVNRESLFELQEMLESCLNVHFITIDVAHAHHDNVKPMVAFIKENFPKTKLIVGNVATSDGVAYLCNLKVDGIKVGIGGGSICTTRYMTGFHIPTLQSVSHAAGFISVTGYNIPIIADGGAKHYGDIAKALKFGASMVMNGGWFASCIDSPAKIIEGKKIYRGSTSYESKGHTKHVEGKQVELITGTTYQERFNEINDAIKSSISYAGGSDLSAFESVEYGRILPFH